MTIDGRKTTNEVMDNITTHTDNEIVHEPKRPFKSKEYASYLNHIEVEVTAGERQIAEYIKMWRQNAQLSQRAMAEALSIPQRTIENWESESRTPADWAGFLVIEKLIQITEDGLYDKARKWANQLKADENGNRPEIKWAVMMPDNDCGYVTRELYDSMMEAYTACRDSEIVGIGLYNQGTSDSYEDRDGNIYPDWDEAQFEL